MSVFWFVLAAVALIGAAVLMYVDRGRARPNPEPAAPRGRADWARLRGLDHAVGEEGLTARWRRGAFEGGPGPAAVDVAKGLLDGSQMYVMDLRSEDSGDSGDSAAVGAERAPAAGLGTVVALQRPMGSTAVFDLRSETSPAPGEPDVHILGAVGRFFAFSNDLAVARRVCDRRMVAFAEAVPERIDTMWSEDDWTFAWLSAGSAPDDWDDAIAAIARFTDLVRVLPPDHSPSGPVAASHDPGGPRP